MDKERISAYITELFASQDRALVSAREDSPKKGLPAISIRTEEGRFLQVLARTAGAVRALEIGTLGGYSGIWIARGLAPGGKLITLELEHRHAQVAREHFAAAGVADRVEVRVGDAHRSLDALAGEPPFDFVFIDAEKSGYPVYFAWALEHTRTGGLITAHNVLRRGRVLDTDNPDEYTRQMQSFNRLVAAESRVIATIYPGGDGMLLAVKIA